MMKGLCFTPDDDCSELQSKSLILVFQWKAVLRECRVIPLYALVVSFDSLLRVARALRSHSMQTSSPKALLTTL